MLTISGSEKYSFWLPAHTPDAARVSGQTGLTSLTQYVENPEIPVAAPLIQLCLENDVVLTATGIDKTHKRVLFFILYDSPDDLGHWGNASATGQQSNVGVLHMAEREIG